MPSTVMPGPTAIVRRVLTAIVGRDHAELRVEATDVRRVDIVCTGFVPEADVDLRGAA